MVILLEKCVEKVINRKWWKIGLKLFTKESERGKRGGREREEREMLSKMCEKQLIVNIVEFLKRIQINEYLNTEYFSNKLSKQKLPLKDKKTGRSNGMYRVVTCKGKTKYVYNYGKYLLINI